MTQLLLISLIAFYPINIGASGSYTYGTYSTGSSYGSLSTYLSIDRKSKDELVIGYERLGIANDSTNYTQECYLIRGLWWIRPETQFGIISGIIRSNDVDQGWLLGGRLTGDLDHFSYALESDLAVPTFFDYTVGDTVSKPVTHLNVTLSRRIGWLVVRGGGLSGVDGGSKRIMGALRIALPWEIGTYVAAEGKWGEGRFVVDPHSMLVDNNPDILIRSYLVEASYRALTNVTLSAAYTYNRYTPHAGSGFVPDYSVRYWSAGLLFRY